MIDPRFPGQQPLFDERACQDQRALHELPRPEQLQAARDEARRRLIVGLVLLLLLSMCVLLFYRVT